MHLTLWKKLLTIQAIQDFLDLKSVTWRVMGDVSSFIGGIRALLIQAAHPEVAAGVANHSNYRDDPLGRLSRTASYVTATAFGAMHEVEKSIDMVSSAHRPVNGTSSRGEKYSAKDPEMATWVHNALIDSFLVSFQHFRSSASNQKRNRSICF